MAESLQLAESGADLAPSAELQPAQGSGGPCRFSPARADPHRGDHDWPEGEGRGGERQRCSRGLRRRVPGARSALRSDRRVLQACAAAPPGRKASFERSPKPRGCRTVAYLWIA